MSRKFVQLCEVLSGSAIARERWVLYDAVTKLNLGNLFICMYKNSQGLYII